MKMLRCLFTVLCILCLTRYYFTAEGIRNLIFLCCLYYLAWTDLDRYVIPNPCLVCAVVIWLVFSFWITDECSWWNSVKGNLLAAVLYGGGILLLTFLVDLILGKKSLGGGDVKLLAVMGLYLGPVVSMLALYIACIIGAIFILVRRQRCIPFGPAIAISTGIMLIYGSELAEWYLMI